jgi:hypothetical protein
MRYLAESLGADRIGAAGSLFGGNPWVCFGAGVFFAIATLSIDHALCHRNSARHHRQHLKYPATVVLFLVLAITDLYYRDVYLGCLLVGIIPVVLFHWFYWGSGNSASLESQAKSRAPG